MGHGRPESMTIGHCMGLAAVAAIWMGGKPSIGYLAKVGPAPLRFKAPAKMPEEILPLPPLAMEEPPAPPPEEMGPPPPPVMPVVAAEPEPEPPPQQPVVQPPPILSPQMLVPFFSRVGTNDVTAIVPYQFSPPSGPSSIPAPPSKATYTTK